MRRKSRYQDTEIRKNITIMWKADFVNFELECLAEISKQSVEGLPGFFLQLMINWERKEMKEELVKLKGTRCRKSSAYPDFRSC